LAEKHAIVINGVAQDHLLERQRDVRHLHGQLDVGIGIYDIAFHIVIVLYFRIGVLRGDLRVDRAASSCSGP
jgi:hypothetical protein